MQPYNLIKAAIAFKEKKYIDSIIFETFALSLNLHRFLMDRPTDNSRNVDFTNANEVMEFCSELPEVTHVLSRCFNRVGINCVNFVGAGHKEILLRNISICRNYTMSAPYSIVERGTPNSSNYRVFLKNSLGKLVSPLHDIPLHANDDKNVYNMVVEVPRWTNAKMEICLGEPLNPIKQDIKKGKLRFVANCFPHHGYIWNYGAFPQTWENPDHLDTATACKGDNDPIDVLEIGYRVATRGEVVQVKILGIIALIDEGETDWKVITIDVNDPLASQMNDIGDVEKHFPGLLKATIEWFKIYKIPDGKPENQFAFNGEAKNASFAINIVNETHEFWNGLISKEIENDEISCANTNVPESPEHINEDRANELFNESIDGGEAEPISDVDDKAAVQKPIPEKKKWIHDPTSDLCRPLNCKKRELCLLEDAYTARKSIEDEEVDEDVVSDEKNSSASQFEDSGIDDDVFYDSDGNEQDEDSCKPCPVTKPSFLCGVDNRTYSSICRLEYHNCIHGTAIKALCKGFCPCKDHTDVNSSKQQRMAERQKTMQNKIKMTLENEDNQKIKDEKNRHFNHINSQITYTPEDVKYDNKHYKYIKYTSNKKEQKPEKHKVHGYNDVIEKNNPKYFKSGNGQKFSSKPIECKADQLTAIGNRLLDWFSVIMTDSKKRRQHSQKSKAHFPAACKAEARWMFNHLDLNNDGSLSTQELYDLEHDQQERCIKPFIDTCDLDNNNTISPRAYAPDCDTQGFYKSTQCHNSEKIFGM
ncbi:Inorganic pyrophosphatase [Pseudolycoriella hygida]|uniref:Inorganic pyrophosphatase n=1 Tax=Pseudolycoriella hygida TaxID=35572 RepID=A0A9Q0MXP2_9DIPT|nr:Inorganic pyrophosphatase [Pseudolycoriella hygida]